VGPKAGLDDLEQRKFLNLPGLELRHLGFPARRQSQYRLRSPGSHFHRKRDEIRIQQKRFVNATAVPSKVLLASYQVSYRITRDKKL
jgi:hypothetical protein